MIKNTPEKISKLRTYVRNNSSNFYDFIQNCTESIIDDDGIQSFTKNQIEYLVDSNGNLVVDHIGRFEKLDDFHKLFFEKIGFEKKIVIPHVNHNSTHKYYTEYYNESTRKIVENRFMEDIQFFNYNFEDKTIFKKIIDNLRTRKQKTRDINNAVNYMSALKQGKFK